MPIMEIKSLKDIAQVKNTIDKIREYTQEEGEIDGDIYYIYDNYIKLYKEQAAFLTR